MISLTVYLTLLDACNPSHDVFGSQPMKGLEGKAYEALQNFVHTAEDEARLEMMQARRRAKKSSNALSDPSFVFYKAEMERVVELDGDPTVQWVLRGQAGAWRAARQSLSGK